MNKNVGNKLVLVRDRHGNIVNKTYYKNGIIHKDGQPAIVWYFRDGKIDTEIYMKNGKKAISLWLFSD